jgi:hypothetical protein
MNEPQQLVNGISIDHVYGDKLALGVVLVAILYLCPRWLAALTRKPLATPTRARRPVNDRAGARTRLPLGFRPVLAEDVTSLLPATGTP